MARASIAGAGMTTFGIHDQSLPELFADAAFDAVDDAGVALDEVGALYLGNAMGGMTENETHLAPKIASQIGVSGIPCQRFEDACATSSNAFKHAVQAVTAGIHDVVLVGGVERCTQETGRGTPEMTRIFASASHRQFEQPTGLTFPGVFALMTKRYMHDYGATREDLADIAVKNHYHGSMNPRAHFGEIKTVDEILESPTIADPFTLYDCSPFSDGASAVVVTSADLAPSFTDAPVDVAAIGHRTDTVPIADKASLTATKTARDASEDAYEAAGIDPSDVDIAEVHDCFTGAEAMAIEALGLVETGEGASTAGEERTYLGGEIPVNPSGGLKAKGHPIGATGSAQLVELTEQLRGESGDRQVTDATTGVAHNLGGSAATTVITVLEART